MNWLSMTRKKIVIVFEAAQRLHLKNNYWLVYIDKKVVVVEEWLIHEDHDNICYYSRCLLIEALKCNISHNICIYLFINITFPICPVGRVLVIFWHLKCFSSPWIPQGKTFYDFLLCLLLVLQGTSCLQRKLISSLASQQPFCSCPWALERGQAIQSRPPLIKLCIRGDWRR